MAKKKKKKEPYKTLFLDQVVPPEFDDVDYSDIKIAGERLSDILIKGGN